MSEQAYNYDVAFSFHGDDEPLASQLNDRICDRFKTFLYSRKQELLAGRDGELAFGSVFQKEARIVVVLYRSAWGQTPFTRIEETAIRNRAFDHGYDFSLFIQTEKGVGGPPWLPKPRLYFGLERFGLDGAAAVIESLVEQAGGDARVETAEARAERFARERARAEERLNFRNSVEGVKAGGDAVDEAVKATEALVAKVATTSPHLSAMKFRKIQDLWVLLGLGPTITVWWWSRYANTLEESPVRVEFYDGPAELPGTYPPLHPGRKVSQKNFDIGLLATGEVGFALTADKSERSPEGLAAFLVTSYLELAEKFKSR